MQNARVIAISEDEYLDGERLAKVKHEYVGGQVFAMAGASKNHGKLAGNIFALLRNHLRGRRCDAFVADMKVRIAAASAFYYPDVVVTCDSRDLAPAAPQDHLRHPSIIVEVLSPTTERVDRREKLLAYRHLPSLVEYVLIDQDRHWIEVYRRADAGWMQEILGPGDTLRLSAVDLSVPIEAVYEDVAIEAAQDSLPG